MMTSDQARKFMQTILDSYWLALDALTDPKFMLSSTYARTFVDWFEFEYENLRVRHHPLTNSPILDDDPEKVTRFARQIAHDVKHMPPTDENLTDWIRTAIARAELGEL